MSDKYEFITTKWQYFFNAAIKNLEMAFLTVVGAVAANVAIGFFDQSTPINVNKIALGAVFMLVVMLIYSVGHYWVNIKLLKYDLPLLVLDDKGITFQEFGGEKKYSWSEVTKITVRGAFRKIIKLNERRGAIDVIDYYLFEPKQRLKLLKLLNSRVGEKSSHS